MHVDCPGCPLRSWLSQLSRGVLVVLLGPGCPGYPGWEVGGRLTHWVPVVPLGPGCPGCPGWGGRVVVVPAGPSCPGGASRPVGSQHSRWVPLDPGAVPQPRSEAGGEQRRRRRRGRRGGEEPGRAGADRRSAGGQGTARRGWRGPAGGRCSAGPHGGCEAAAAEPSPTGLGGRRGAPGPALPAGGAALPSRPRRQRPPHHGGLLRPRAPHPGVSAACGLLGPAPRGEAVGRASPALRERRGRAPAGGGRAGSARRRGGTERREGTAVGTGTARPWRGAGGRATRLGLGRGGRGGADVSWASGRAFWLVCGCYGA